jgi:hypothetical protein
MKRHDDPVLVRNHDLMPGPGGDGHPSAFDWPVRNADEGMGMPLVVDPDLKSTAAPVRHGPLVAVRVTLRARGRTGAEDEHPARTDHLGKAATINSQRNRLPGHHCRWIARQLLSHPLHDRVDERPDRAHEDASFELQQNNSLITRDSHRRSPTSVTLPFTGDAPLPSSITLISMLTTGMCAWHGSSWRTHVQPVAMSRRNG